jgi:hypothetical protein
MLTVVFGRGTSELRWKSYVKETKSVRYTEGIREKLRTLTKSADSFTHSSAYFKLHVTAHLSELE